MPRFVPLSPQPTQPPQPGAPTGGGGGRFVRVGGPGQQQPGQAPSRGGSSPLGGAFGASRFGANLLGLGGRFVGSPTLTGGSQLAGGVAGLGQGALNLSQGNTAPGALQLAGGTGQLLQGAGTLLPQANALLGGGLTTGGQALGAAGGLAGLGLGLSQGGQAGERAAVQAAQQIAGALIPGFGLVSLIGSAVENLVNFGLGEGAFGQTPLPLGRPGPSSAENLASQTSYMRGQAIPGRVTEALGNMPDLQSALRLIGSRVSPYGEYQVGSAGLPGYVGENTGGSIPGWDEAFQDVLTLNDPQKVANFIANLWVQTGESGVARYSPAETFKVRSAILEKLPQTPAWQAFAQQVRDAGAGIDPRDPGWAQQLATPIAYQSAGALRFPTTHQYSYYDVTTSPPSHRPATWEEVQRAAQAPNALGDQPGAMKFYTDLSTGQSLASYRDPYNPNIYNPTFLDPSGSQYASLLAAAQAPLLAASPSLPEPEPNTPEWYAKYVPL